MNSGKLRELGALARILPVLVTASVWRLSASAGETGPLHAAQACHSYKLATTAGREITVVGTNAHHNMEVARWADRVLDRTGSALGFEMSFGDWRDTRILLQYSPEAANTAAVRRVSSAQAARDGALVQRLYLVGYPEIDQREAEEALCGMLVDAEIVHRRSKFGVPVNGADMGGTVRAPDWLRQGLAGDLDADVRSVNGAHVYEQWRRGKAPTVSEILGTNRTDETSSVYGVFIGWLQSHPGKKECFSGILDAVARNEPISAAWLAGHVKGCEGVADLERDWDEWIARAERVVYDPGKVTDLGVDGLRMELILRPGRDGVPMIGDPYKIYTMNDLIEERDSDWVPVAAASRITALRVFGAGRGGRINEVVEKYCAYLAAVRNRRNDKELRNLLNEAEQALTAVSQQTSSRLR